MDQFLEGGENLYNILTLSPAIKEHLLALDLKEHLFIESSGTGGTRKIYALSKDALLLSAHDVNKMLDATSDDIWMCPLPTHHIGGFSILLRASLTRSQVHYYTQKWSPSNFYKQLCESESTLLSLVPTQLFDLVQSSYRSPEKLRAVIIGGDHLPSNLADRAMELGWPIYHSYGMTEFGSQIATSKYSEGGIEILHNFNLELIDGLIAISSPKMFTSITTVSAEEIKTQSSATFCRDGFYLTKDRGIIEGNKVTIFGRSDRTVKFKGQYLDLSQLDKALANLLIEYNLYNQAVLRTSADERTGIRITIIASEKALELKEVIINCLTGIFEPLRGCIDFEAIERISTTDLGKILHKQ